MFTAMLTPSKKINYHNNIMKKKSIVLVCLIISAICINLSAQTSKGKFLIGGITYIEQIGSGVTTTNIGYTTIINKDDSGDEDEHKDKGFSFNFTPKVGYFVIDNLVLGVDFTFASSSSKTTNTEYKNNATYFGAGPFVRYYIPTKKVLPYAEVMYSVGSRTTKSIWEDGENTYKYGIQVYSVGVGVAIPLGEKASFDTLVGYHSTTYKAKQENENNQRTIIGTIGFKLGFTLFLGYE